MLPMKPPKSTSLRERLQELLAIPESRRTDAEWDELHELEVTMMHASGKPIATQKPQGKDMPRHPQHHAARGNMPVHKQGQGQPPSKGKRQKSRKGRFSTPK